MIVIAVVLSGCYIHRSASLATPCSAKCVKMIVLVLSVLIWVTGKQVCVSRKMSIFLKELNIQKEWNVCKTFVRNTLQHCT